MGFIANFKWLWDRRKKFPPDDIHRAGELAEMRLVKLSRAAGKNSGWEIYDSVRIPDPDGGRREIDMVLIGGNQILVVEQKHWAGSFVINKEHQFIQTRKNGSNHNHDGVADRIARKARLLKELHCKRLDLNEEQSPEVRVIVAMTHQKLEWPKIPNDLAAEMVNEKGFIDIVKNVKPGPPSDDLLATMGGFNTWDEVHLHGGLMKKGDVLQLGLGEEINNIFASRKDVVSAETQQKRGFLSIFDKNPANLSIKIGNKNAAIKLGPHAKLKMHVVGDESPSEINWSNIVKISLSKPPEEWNKN